MSSTRRGIMLNTHGKKERLNDYYSLPATLQNPPYQKAELFADVIGKGKEFLARLGKNVYNYIFPRAEINYQVKHRSFFEVLAMNPIAAGPEERTDREKLEKYGDPHEAAMANLKQGLVLKRPPCETFESCAKKRKSYCLNSASQTDLPYSLIVDQFKEPFNSVLKTKTVLQQTCMENEKKSKLKGQDSSGEMETKGTDEEEELEFQRKTSEKKRRVIRKVVRQKVLSINRGPELEVISEKPSKREIDEVIEQGSFEDYKKYMQNYEKCLRIESSGEEFPGKPSITSQNVSNLDTKPHIQPHNPFSFANEAPKKPEVSSFSFETPQNLENPFETLQKSFENPQDSPIIPSNSSVHPEIPFAQLPIASQNPFLNINSAKTTETPFNFGSSIQVPSVTPIQIENISSEMMCDTEMQSSHTPYKSLPIEKPVVQSTDLIKTPNSTQGPVFSSTNLQSLFPNNSSLFKTSEKTIQNPLTFGNSTLFAPSPISSINTSNNLPNAFANIPAFASSPNQPSPFANTTNNSPGLFAPTPQSLFSNTSTMFGGFTPIQANPCMFAPNNSGTSTPNTISSTPIAAGKPNFSLGVVANSGKRQRK